jgi:hypothetical protein
MADRETLKGATTGYKLGARFELTNGQVWEQTSSEYDYQYWYRPDVLLDASGSRGRLKITTMQDWVDVMRVDISSM